MTDDWNISLPRTFINLILFPMEDFFSSICVLSIRIAYDSVIVICILCLCPRLRPFSITYTPRLSLLHKIAMHSHNYYGQSTVYAISSESSIDLIITYGLLTLILYVRVHQPTHRTEVAMSSE